MKRDRGVVRLAGKLLRAVLPEGARGDSIAGDLIEEYREEPPGISRDWRYLAAAVRLGVGYGVQRCLQPARRQRGIGSEGLTDLKQSLRALRKRPLFVTINVVTWTVGLGASITVFTLVYGSLLAPLPYPESERLVRIGQHFKRGSAGNVSSMSVANFLDLDSASKRFELAAYTYSSFALSGGEGAQQMLGQRVTWDFFKVLGLRPHEGRFFVASDDRVESPPTVVLSQRLWRREFGAQRSVIGSTIQLDSAAHTVIGVAGPDFTFPTDSDLWVPYRWTARERAVRGGRRIEGVGRLAPDVTPAEGMRELTGLFAALERAWPEANQDISVAGVPFGRWIIGPSAPRRLALFSAAAALVLLVACANVAGVGLVRADGRSRELALRTALGASRWRIARLLLAEGMVVAAAGGALAIVLARWLTDYLLFRFGAWIPRAGQIETGPAVILFAVAVCLTAGGLVAVAPAISRRARPLLPGLATTAGSGRRHSRLHSGLVIAEVALAVVLVSAAGLIVRSVWALSQVDLGVDTRHVVAFSLRLPQLRYPDTAEAMAFYDRALAEFRSLPGVELAGAQNRLPLASGGNSSVSLNSGEQPYEGLVEMRDILPGLFETLGQRIIRGRGLSEADRRAGAPVVVNQAFVRAFFGGEGGLGRLIRPAASERTFEIVGVVSDVRNYGPDRPAPPAAYYAYGNGPWRSWPYMAFVLRSAEDPLQLVPSIRQRLAQLDPAVPLAELETLQSMATRKLGAQRRTALFLLTSFAAVALALSAIGLYGVLAYGVRQRRHELGVRRALGATDGQISGLVLRQGLRLALAGITIGVLAAAPVTRAMRDLLYDVAPMDPLALGAVVILVVLVATSACVLPARRAAAVPAWRALKAD